MANIAVIRYQEPLHIKYFNYCVSYLISDSVNEFINESFAYVINEIYWSGSTPYFILKNKLVKLNIILFILLTIAWECSQKHLIYVRNTELNNTKFKCENDGIKMFNEKDGYSCWCTPDYVGEYCQTKKPVSFMSHIISLLGLGNSDGSRGRPTMWWSIFPFTSGLQLETVYSFHQSAVKRLVNVSTGAENNGYAASILPPRCPLIICKLDKKLPKLDTLYNGIFKRKPCQFIPDQNNRNLLYNTFYQYFVLQFFDANSNLTVTASQLYGSDPVLERWKRSCYGGKLKTLKYNHNDYLPNRKFALRSNMFLDALQYYKHVDKELGRMIAFKFKQAGMLSTSPLLFVLSTLWVREHNRVCDELSRKSPSWTDEELYTTARKIVTGQMMTIMMNEILNVELKPEVYHHRMENISSSRTPIELYLTTALSSLQDNLQYSSTILTCFSNTRQVSEAGLKDALKVMVNSKMGMVTAHNDGALTEDVTKKLMTLSRQHCLQGFNDYRRLLGLPVYNSFIHLTGNNNTATELKNLYSNVENVELLTGILAERSSSGALPTTEFLSNSFIINAILTNNLTSKHSWAPDTFGGVEFFDLVKSTSLKSLVYQNVDMSRDELQVRLYAKKVDR